jgi:hypothetical protein
VRGDRFISREKSNVRSRRVAGSDGGGNERGDDGEAAAHEGREALSFGVRKQRSAWRSRT